MVKNNIKSSKITFAVDATEKTCPKFITGLDNILRSKTKALLTGIRQFLWRPFHTTDNFST